GAGDITNNDEDTGAARRALVLPGARRSDGERALFPSGWNICASSPCRPYRCPRSRLTFFGSAMFLRDRATTPAPARNKAMGGEVEEIEVMPWQRFPVAQWYEVFAGAGISCSSALPTRALMVSRTGCSARARRRPLSPNAIALFGGRAEERR